MTATRLRHPLGVGRRVALALVLLAVSTLGGSTSARAKGDDPCPEPNDSFQSACYLGTDGDALGFISNPGDIDAYRFEARDFNTKLHVALVERPFPYRLNLANYNGDIVESSPNGEFETTVSLPGTYYIFVDSGTGGSSDGAPYVLNASASYASPPGPQVVYSHEFSRNSPDAFQESGSRSFSNEHGTYTLDPNTNRFTFAMNPGSANQPTAEAFVLKPDPPEPGPVVETFTMVIDTRMLEPADAGYKVLFRYDDPTADCYQVTVRLGPKQASIGKIVNGDLNELTGLRPVPGLNPTGVNRTIIRAAGRDIRVNINGQDVIQIQDASYSRGLIGFGAITWAGPATFNFDNILVTVP
jgi:hypothetical protein